MKSMKSKIPAIFLDRDGVINEKMPEGDYVKNVQEFKFLPGAVGAMKLLGDLGFPLFIVTNQRGIARGVMSENDLNEIHGFMQAELAQNGIGIKGIYFCPHDYGMCDCRKPLPGMLLRAATEHDIDLAASVVVGDDIKDMELAKNAGCKGILVDEKRNLFDVARELIL